VVVVFGVDGVGVRVGVASTGSTFKHGRSMIHL
jgi:hypothetical protein